MSGVNINNCYTLGTVYGLVNNVSYPNIDTPSHRYGEYIGGVIGCVESNVIIDRCYSKCEVVGGNYLGGIVGGYEDGQSSKVTRAAAYEIVWGISAETLGRIAGKSSSLTSCYYVGGGKMNPSRSFAIADRDGSNQSTNPNDNWWLNTLSFDTTNIWTNTGSPPTLRGMPTP